MWAFPFYYISLLFIYLLSELVSWYIIQFTTGIQSGTWNTQDKFSSTEPLPRPASYIFIFKDLWSPTQTQQVVL